MTKQTPVTGARTLRLVWPQWQGAGRGNVAGPLPEFRPALARHGYAVGSHVLDAVLPEHQGPSEIVPVGRDEPGEGSTDGIESRSVILASLTAVQEAIARHDVDRILTLGGECAVSVAPFAALADRYGDDLAVVWIDAHPNADTPRRATKTSTRWPPPSSPVTVTLRSSTACRRPSIAPALPMPDCMPASPTPSPGD